jgi:hypothetical protein
MQLTGIIKVKKEEQVVSDKFRKREFVLTDNSSQYPQLISFQLTQDRCSLLDQIQVGETVVVHFNIRGREWTSPQGEVKYFNTLEAWKIDRGPAGSSQPMEQYENVPTGQSVQDKDDLPF